MKTDGHLQVCAAKLRKPDFCLIAHDKVMEKLARDTHCDRVQSDMANAQLQVDNLDELKSKIHLHPQWVAVQEIVKTLAQNGYSCYLVGGSVRDYLLNVEPADLDLATEATPSQIQALFPRVLRIGHKFAVSQVVFGENVIDVATFRQEDLYFDGRHPEKIIFSGIAEDVHRRDFTVNSLYLNLLTFELYDFYHGRDDLLKKILRTVGDPQKRFLEDHLRLMRAVRFAARFDLQMEQATKAAISQHRHLIQNLSNARRTEELKKGFVLVNRVVYFALLNELGLWDVLFPKVQFAPLHFEDSETLMELQRVSWSEFLLALYCFAEHRERCELASLSLLPNQVHNPQMSSQTRNQNKQRLESFFSNLLLLRSEKQQMLLILLKVNIDLERQDPFIFREFLRQLHI